MLRIFISYRREDSVGYALRIWDNLIHQYGKENIFMDVNRIEPSKNFLYVIKHELSKCDVLLAIIGRNWLTIMDVKGKRRLDKPDDWVRLEIEVAIKRKLPIVPVLVNGANPPHFAELPESITSFSRYQALYLRDRDEEFNQDFENLIKTLKNIEVDTICKKGNSCDTNQIDLALSYFTRAHELSPERADVYAYRANCYTTKGEFKRAIKDCKQAIFIDPNNSYYHYLLGVNWLFTRNIWRALNSLSHAIEIDPEKPEYYYWRAKAYNHQFRKKAVRRDLETAVGFGHDDAKKELKKLKRLLWWR